MSHLNERKERNCLNCNSVLQGKYCHICGQENVEPKETVWHLVSHFFQDITHFDGKFFHTLRYLVWKPGFISREYINGRRASYLNPVRMYVFTSAFFFLVFFTVYKVDTLEVKKGISYDGKTIDMIQAMDSAVFADFTRKINMKENGIGEPMSREAFKNFTDTVRQKSFFLLPKGPAYKSKAAYDSAISSGKIHDNWWKQQFINKFIEINRKFGNNMDDFGSELAKSMIHRLPQLLFISLPFLALLLKLLYIQRKKFFYVDHGIFSIHFYIFIFITMLILFALNKLDDQLHLGFINSITAFFVAVIFFYQYKAMRNFYGQRRLKTIVKFLILNFFFFFVMNILFLLFIFFSFFNI